MPDTGSVGSNYIRIYADANGAAPGGLGYIDTGIPCLNSGGTRPLWKFEMELDFTNSQVTFYATELAEWNASTKTYESSKGAGVRHDLGTFGGDTLAGCTPASLLGSGGIGFIDGGGSGTVMMFDNVEIIMPPSIADLFNDGSINATDLKIMLDDWLGGNSIGDIYPPPPSNDNIVDMRDFNVLGIYWEQ